MTFVSPPLDAFADAAKKKYAATRNLGELMWTQYPGHFNQALSKAIVTPATGNRPQSCSTRRVRPW